MVFKIMFLTPTIVCSNNVQTNLMKKPFQIITSPLKQLNYGNMEVMMDTEFILYLIKMNKLQLLRKLNGISLMDIFYLQEKAIRNLTN
jgi:hypothetical protein